MEWPNPRPAFEVKLFDARVCQIAFVDIGQNKAGEDEEKRDCRPA